MDCQTYVFSCPLDSSSSAHNTDIPKSTFIVSSGLKKWEVLRMCSKIFSLADCSSCKDSISCHITNTDTLPSLVQSHNITTLCPEKRIPKYFFVLSAIKLERCFRNSIHRFLQIYTLYILTDFQNYFTVRIRRKRVTILSSKIPPHLKCAATLPCEMWNECAFGLRSVARIRSIWFCVHLIMPMTTEGAQATLYE